MLYNPQWDHLIDFLGKKDPQEGYNYSNSSCCLAAQFNKAAGREYIVPFTADHADHEQLKRTGDFDKDMELVAKFGEHTFGAALQRAKELMDA